MFIEMGQSIGGGEREGLAIYVSGGAAGRGGAVWSEAARPNEGLRQTWGRRKARRLATDGIWEKHGSLGMEAANFILAAMSFNTKKDTHLNSC